MSEDLTPAGAAAVRLALMTSALRAEVEALRAQARRVEALADEWSRSEDSARGETGA